MKVSTILEVYEEHKGPLLGVEIEVEGQDLPPREVFHQSSWKKIADGSLRGESAEFIFSRPLSLSKGRENVLKLLKIFKDHQSIVYSSPRTSVHVHLNVIDVELQHLANILYIYYLLEDILLRYCGEERRQNRFCLSIREADGILQELSLRFNKRNLCTFTDEAHKYSALNLACLKKYGSIEFRGMRGCVDTAVLFPWFEVIISIYREAAKFKDVKNIFEMIQSIGVMNFCRRILKDNFEKFQFEGMEDEIQYNLSLCAELINTLQMPKENEVREENLF